MNQGEELYVIYLNKETDFEDFLEEELMEEMLERLGNVIVVSFV